MGVASGGTAPLKPQKCWPMVLATSHLPSPSTHVSPLVQLQFPLPTFQFTWALNFSPPSFLGTAAVTTSEPAVVFHVFIHYFFSWILGKVQPVHAFPFSSGHESAPHHH